MNIVVFSFSTSSRKSVYNKQHINAKAKHMKSYILFCDTTKIKGIELEIKGLELE